MASEEKNPDDIMFENLIQAAKSGDTESATSLVWHMLNDIAEGHKSQPLLCAYAANARDKITDKLLDDGSAAKGASIQDALHLRRKKKGAPKSEDKPERDWLLACLIATHLEANGGLDDKGARESAFLAIATIPNSPFHERMASRAWKHFEDEAVVFPLELYNELIAYFTKHKS